MLKSFLGKKIGMTQVFNDAGQVVPVTIIEAGPCAVTQIRTPERDGYAAVQLGFGRVRRPNRPEAGHLRGSQIGRRLQEVPADDIGGYEVGQLVSVDIFEAGEIVDVSGRSKGPGLRRDDETARLRRGAAHARAVRPVPGRPVPLAAALRRARFSRG